MPRIELSIQGAFLAQLHASICQNLINEYVEVGLRPNDAGCTANGSG